MSGPPPPDDAEFFDEAGYLRLYPGIAEALMRGHIDSAWFHYVHHGRDEGRQPNDVDPGFYALAYPDGQNDPISHYFAHGRYRGYLPNARAPRMPNAARESSAFGGLWTDQGDALDLIQGRSDLGRLKRRETVWLRNFALDGIAEPGPPLDGEQLQDAAMFVERMFAGLFPELLCAADPMGESAELWRPELTARPMAALDPHMFSRNIRTVLFHPTVTEALSLLFDAPPRLTASRAFLRPEMEADRDAAWFDYSLPLRFAAVTFVLEDADADAGQISIWPGSHRLPDLGWPTGHVSLTEARRMGMTGLTETTARRQDRVMDLLGDRTPRILPHAAGTVMIRHPNLIHAASAPAALSRRKTLTAWYCPSYVVPSYQEIHGARPHEQDGFRFSSGVYPSLDPRD